MSYKNEIIDVEDLCLDQKNYRIDFDRYNTIEEEVDRLYEDEDIIGMIKEIVNFKGLHPNDIPIVIPKDDSKYTVVEGNRRLLAVKSLLGLIKPPPRYKREVDTLKSKLSDETLNSLRQLLVVVYDINDDDYLQIIASKHSTISYERWGQVSQWHFFKDMFISNSKDLEITSNKLGINKGEVSSHIRYYNLLNYIRSLDYWDEKGLRDQIEKNNKLQPTKFTRPLSSKLVLNELNIDFDNELELKIPKDNKDEFDYILCMYAEAALINDKNDDDYIYTRSEPPDVVELIKGWKEEYRKHNTGNITDFEEKKKVGEINDVEVGQEKKGTVNEPKIRGRRKNPVKYFSNLKCTIEDSRLRRLSHELSKMNMTQFPAAAIMLTRSLLESSLLYQIEKKKLQKEYYNYKGKNGLKKILNFSISFKNSLFVDPKSANGLEYLENTKYKEFMDDIVHSKWIDPNESDVANIAGKIRELIQAIISDKA